LDVAVVFDVAIDVVVHDCEVGVVNDSEFISGYIQGGMRGICSNLLSVA